MFPLLRSISRPPDEELTDLDFRYLGFLMPCTKLQPRVLNLHSRFQVREALYFVDIHVPWPDFPLSSKAFRYATLALSTATASTSNSNYDSPDLFRYLAKFYKYIGQAIQSSSYIEVLVASYTAMLCGFKTGQPLETILIYFDGICQAYSQLVVGCSGGTLDSKLCFTITPLLLGSLRTLELAYLARDPCATGDQDLITQVRDSLQGLALWLCSRSRFSLLPLAVNPTVRLEGLGYYLRLYFDDYLAAKRRHNHSGRPAVTDSLRQVISEIMAIVPQMAKGRKLLQDAMDEGRDWPWLHNRAVNVRINTWNIDLEGQDCALLFAFAAAIEDAINKSEADVEIPECIVSPSLLLCHVSALIWHETLGIPCKSFSLTKYIFWAGLWLPSSVDGRGTSPAT